MALGSRKTEIPDILQQHRPIKRLLASRKLIAVEGEGLPGDLRGAILSPTGRDDEQALLFYYDGSGALFVPHPRLEGELIPFQFASSLKDAEGFNRYRARVLASGPIAPPCATAYLSVTGGLAEHYSGDTGLTLQLPENWRGQPNDLYDDWSCREQMVQGSQRRQMAIWGERSALTGVRYGFNMLMGSLKTVGNLVGTVVPVLRVVPNLISFTATQILPNTRGWLVHQDHGFNYALGIELTEEQAALMATALALYSVDGFLYNHFNIRGMSPRNFIEQLFLTSGIDLHAALNLNDTWKERASTSLAGDLALTARQMLRGEGFSAKQVAGISLDGLTNRKGEDGAPVEIYQVQQNDTGGIFTLWRSPDTDGAQIRLSRSQDPLYRRSPIGVVPGIALLLEKAREQGLYSLGARLFWLEEGWQQDKTLTPAWQRDCRNLRVTFSERDLEAQAVSASHPGQDYRR